LTDRKYITLHAALLHIAFRGQPVPSNTDAFAALERAARELQTTLEDGRVVAIGLKNGRGPHQAIEDKFWVAAEFEAIADDEIDVGNLRTYPDANTSWTKYAHGGETATYKDVRVDRYMLEKLWPSVLHAESAAPIAKPKSIALKTERDAQYLERVREVREAQGRLPTFKEDDEWRKRVGVTQETIRRLRAAHLADEYKKGGRPKKTS
jgi:hypothetical protein